MELPKTQEAYFPYSLTREDMDIFYTNPFNFDRFLAAIKSLPFSLRA